MSLSKIAIAVAAVLSGTRVLAGEINGTASITIDASRVENHISRQLYAAFAEMMAEDVKWGLTAELIHDGSFEDSADYLGLPAQWRIEPDERNDYLGDIKFEMTTEEAYPKINRATGAAEHSLKVTVAPNELTDERRGFSQGRIAVRAAETYNGYVWVKVPDEDGYRGEVRVLLEQDDPDGETYAETRLAIRKGDWQRYAFALTPSKTDRFAKFTVLFKGKGTLYVDHVSLEPADAKREVRADAEAMIRELHPSFLRWPGGGVAQYYHWQWGIGPRDLRPMWVNKAWSNAPEPNDFGTDEYLALCARLHIEPSITVNVDGDGATAEEAAAWVEYVNGPLTTKFGAMRAANGHAEPYGVRQWELGNELWLSSGYPEAAARYAKAMRAVDPTIQLIAVGASARLNSLLSSFDPKHPFNSDAWNAAVLQRVGGLIDFLAIHDYSLLSTDAKTLDPRSTMMARPKEYEIEHRHIAEEVRRIVPRRNIGLVINEWNVFYPSEVTQSMEGAVYASRMMNGFERDGEIIKQSNISDLLNGWVGGIIQISRDRIYRTPQYWAIKMYSDALGADRLYTEVKSPELAHSVPAIDAVASRSADGSELFLKVSNASLAQEVTAHVDVRGFKHVPQVQLALLSAREPFQRNTFADGLLIAPIASTPECPDSCDVRLPPDSVTIIRFAKTTN